MKTQEIIRFIEALELLDGKQRPNTVYEKLNSAPAPNALASADSAAAAVNSGGATLPQILERDNYKITIRADRMSGWFERNGEAIGGLIFDTLTGRNSGAIELTDYDGVFELPKTVALMLRDAGIHVDSTFM